MAASTVRTVERPGLPILTLRRPNNEASHVQFALYNNATLVVARETSKIFISYTLVNEFSQRYTNKYAILLTDGCSEYCCSEIIKILALLLPNKPLRISLNELFPTEDLTCGGKGTKNVLIMSSDCFLYCLYKEHLKAENISLLLVNFCTPSNLTSYQKSNSAHEEVIKRFKNQKSLIPRLIILHVLKLYDISNASDLRQKLGNIKSTYFFPIHFANDVLASNRFGEEIQVDCLAYGTRQHLQGSKAKTILNNLRETLDLILDTNYPTFFELLKTLAGILTWCIDILIVFGLWAFEYNLKDILRFLWKLESKESDKIAKLYVQTCRSQFELSQSLLKTFSKNSISLFVYKICDILAPYQVYCNVSNTQNSTYTIVPETSQIPADTLGESEQNDHIMIDERHETTDKDYEIQTTMNTKTVAVKSKENLCCVIVTESNSFAKLLSKVLNYLSTCEEKYSFIKCGIITDVDEGDSVNHTENILQAVSQRAINVVVTTRKLSRDLVIGSCNVFLYFGLPESYERFFQLKKKVRGVAPKCVFVVPEKQLFETKQKLKQFKDIEVLFEKHTSGFLSMTKKATWLKCLEQETACYAPCGEGGPVVPLLSSLHIVNTYCQNISRGDFSTVHAHFVSTKHHTSANSVEISSCLYLPLGASVHKASKTSSIEYQPSNEYKLEILKLKMETALECVQLLHKQGELNDNLQLVMKQYCDPEIVVNYELGDEGKGRAGTNKRRRAYELQVPDIFENNMPDTDQPLYLYNLSMEYVKTFNPAKSDNSANSEIALGILCRKELPEIPKFKIYTSYHEIAVSLVRIPSSSPLYLDSSNLQRIRDFHSYIFSQLLTLRSDTILSEKNGYLVVPLVRTATPSQARIHFDFLEEVEENVRWSQSNQVYDDFTIFENKMIRRLVLGVASMVSTKYVVHRVCYDLTPESPFPDLDVAPTFKEYYSVRYAVDVKVDQPLLQVKYCSNHINFIHPRHNQNEEKAAEEMKLVKTSSRADQIYLIPELCGILPISAPAWKVINRLPTIMYRLSGLLLANELLSRVHDQTGVGCDHWPDNVPLPDLDVEHTVGELRVHKVVQEDSVVYVVSKPVASDQCDEEAEMGSVGDGSVGNDHRNNEGLPKDDTMKDVEGGMVNGGHVVVDDHSLAESVSGGQYQRNQSLGHCVDKEEREPSGFGTSHHDQNNHAPERGKALGGFGGQNCDGVSDEHGAVKMNHAGVVKKERELCNFEESDHNQNNQDDGKDFGAYGYMVKTDYVGITLLSQTNESTIGPNVTLILRALTAKSSGQYFYSERLEVLGDSFLKFETSVELFLTENKSDEWGLSVLRGYLVSNDMLSKQGRRVGLPGYITVTPPDISKKFIPPGFELSGGQQNGTASPSRKQGMSLTSYKHQVIGDKHVANCVEALLGAYLVSSGRSGARRLLVWLGITKRSLTNLDDILTSYNALNFNYSSGNQVCNTLGVDEPTACRLPELSSDQLKDVMEKEIGYTFRNRHYLTQVFTHSSYFRSLSPVSENYQTFEFLGDAILDYLVTLYLFSNFPNLDHGDLTDFRSALVNNFTLAFLAVQSRLYQFLKSMLPSLVDVVARFVEFLEKQETKRVEPWKMSVDAFVVDNLNGDESGVEVPKVLGDIFESLVCAVFLDCGMNLEMVWKIFYPMFKPFIDYYKNHIPRSPIRTLQESFPEQVTFSLARLTLSKSYICSVCVVGYGRFEATGRTGKIAKSSVARKALQHIRNISGNTAQS